MIPPMPTWLADRCQPDTCYPKRGMKAGLKGAIPWPRRKAGSCEDDLHGALVAMFEAVGSLPPACLTPLAMPVTTVAAVRMSNCAPPKLTVVAA